MDTFVQILVQGALTSATLALVAVGFSLVFGVGGVVNLAHGSFFLISAYTAVALTGSGVPLFLAVVGGVLAAVTAGVLLARGVVRPLHGQGVSVLIASLSVAIFVEAAARLFFGTHDRNLPSFASGSTSVLGVTVLTSRIVAFVVAVVAIAGLVLLLEKTRAGRIVRAVSEDAEAARLMGIETRHVELMVLALGAGLAGLAGVIVAPFQVVYPGMWLAPLTSAFAIVILGGLGSVSGTIVAALVVGYLDRSVAYLVKDGEIKVGLITIIVILVTLVVRPHGLRGKPGVAH